MKYASIAAALGWTETPELQDGLFLQPEEATKINSELEAVSANQQAVADFATATTTIAERDATIAGLNTSVADMKTAADAAAQTAADTLAARDQRIQELEAQVTELGKGSSGHGTTVSTTVDPLVAESKKSAYPRFDSAEHPANQLADQYTRKR